MWTSWRGSREGPQRQSKTWEAWHARNGYGSSVCSGLRNEVLGKTLIPCSSLWKVATEKMEKRSCAKDERWWVKIPAGDSHLNTRWKCFTVRTTDVVLTVINNLARLISQGKYWILQHSDGAEQGARSSLVQTVLLLRKIGLDGPYGLLPT